jgi:hypothetical protein
VFGCDHQKLGEILIRKGGWMNDPSPAWPVPVHEAFRQEDIPAAPPCTSC